MTEMYVEQDVVEITVGKLTASMKLVKEMKEMKPAKEMKLVKEVRPPVLKRFVDVIILVKAEFAVEKFVESRKLNVLSIIADK